MSSGPTVRVKPANRLGLDYRREAERLGPPPVPIVDVHAHINGAGASSVYADVCRAYGVGLTYTMTQRAHAEEVRAVLGDAVRFIAVPSYMDPDKHRVHREGFLENIEWFHRECGSRVVKFWAAPRFRDMLLEGNWDDVVPLDSEWRVRAAELAQSLGMMFMVHVADPDTWFATKYADASLYGTKRDQYPAMERMLERFPAPWIAAHMGGWPEDLGFLDGLLSRHDNLYLDTSATKWMVRELSRHPRGRLVEFLTKWKGRVLFGSDIVTSDDHLTPGSDPDRPLSAQADGEEAAWELYASRYWALRTLFESDYGGESPIADPDLAMVEPDRYDGMSAPVLAGKALPRDLLESLYGGAAVGLFSRWERGGGG